jgi:hypothetical protein
MRNEPRPIGRLRNHARAPFDAITREELPEHLRELIEKLRQAEPVKSPLNEPPNDKRPPRSKGH